MRRVRRHTDRFSSAQPALLAAHLEHERSRPDLGPALLLGVHMHRLTLGSRRVHAVDAQLLLTQLDKSHPLASTRIGNLLSFAWHETRSLLLKQALSHDERRSDPWVAAHPHSARITARDRHENSARTLLVVVRP